MGKWQTLFETYLLPFEEREYGEQYEFGPPATTEQLEAVEQILEVRLPTDVREMLSEFNGIWHTTRADRKYGYKPTIAFLDTKYMTIEVPHYFRTCGNVLPSEEDLRKVVFVFQSNGFGDLYGVCVENVAGHRTGEVIKIDHEVGEWACKKSCVSSPERLLPRLFLLRRLTHGCDSEKPSRTTGSRDGEPSYHLRRSQRLDAYHDENRPRTHAFHGTRCPFGTSSQSHCFGKPPPSSCPPRRLLRRRKIVATDIPPRPFKGI
jgi:hypothetical protein